jgi:hypothetical protein
MPRTDVHSPRNLVTEDYEFLGCGNFPTAELIGYSPLIEPRAQDLLRDGWGFAENESSGGCYHCGASLIYYAILMHMPTKKFIRVGEQCLDNRFDLASAEFHRLRTERRLNRARRTRESRRIEWMARDQDREIAFAWATYMVDVEGQFGFDGMRHSYVHTVNRGEWMPSDKFTRAIMRDMARTERIAAEREAERLAATPVVEGRQQIVGEVLSTKWKENAYGGRLVMTVKDDRGFMVWGSVPSTLDNLDRGDRVSFTATVSVSDTDETFGFFKRPTKAEVL